MARYRRYRQPVSIMVGKQELETSPFRFLSGVIRSEHNRCRHTARSAPRSRRFFGTNFTSLV